MRKCLRQSEAFAFHNPENTNSPFTWRIQNNLSGTVLFPEKFSKTAPGVSTVAQLIVMATRRVCHSVQPKEHFAATALLFWFFVEYP